METDEEEGPWGEREREGHRDFKLVEFDRPETAVGRQIEGQVVESEKCLLDIDDDENESAVDKPTPQHQQRNGRETCEKVNERVIAIYYMDTYFKSNSREAKINFFELLPPETELWCLAVALGLQEKISKNQDVMRISSYGYGGGLWCRTPQRLRR